MKQFLSKIGHILKDAKDNFKSNETIVYSAAIAFFTIFSLPAIMIVLTFIGSIFFTKEAVQSAIVKDITDLVSAPVGQQANTVLNNIFNIQAGFWEITIGVLVIIQSSSVIFFMMQKALNAVWQVKVKSGISYLRLIKYRLVALAMVVGMGLLLAVSLLLDTVISIYKQQLLDVLEEHFTPAIRSINTVFYLAVVLIFFTTVHKVLPDAKITWKDGLAGGIITSILFLIGKQLINFLLSNVKLIGIYAAAGSLVVLLLWVFYSSVILLVGAAVTKAYANNHGRKVEPTAIAVKYKEVKDQND